MANGIVVEVLEFVRPIRLQVERTSIAQVLHDAVTMAERKVDRGAVNIAMNVQEQLPLIQADHHQLCQLFTQPADQRLRGAGRQGAASRSRRRRAWSTRSRSRSPGRRDRPPTVVVDVADDGPGVPRGDRGPDLQPVLHDQAAGLRAWGWPSCGRSSTRTTGTSTWRPAPGQGTRFRVTLPLNAGEAWLQ